MTLGRSAASGIGTMRGTQYLRPEMPWNYVVWHAAIVLGCLLNYGGVWQPLREPAASCTDEAQLSPHIYVI